MKASVPRPQESADNSRFVLAWAAMATDLRECWARALRGTNPGADLLDLWEWHHVRPAHATLVLTSVADGRRFGRVEVGRDGRILRFTEKSDAAGPCWINGGVYLMSAALLSRIPAGRSVSLEREVFPRWLERGLYGYPSHGRFIDIGTPESFAAAAAFAESLVRRTHAALPLSAPVQSAIPLAQELA